MKVKKVKACLYISYSKESTIIFLCKFDSNLWEKIWNEICDQYDKENPVKPIHLKVNIKDLKGDLQKYIKKNVTFLCELPSLKANLKLDKNQKIKNQYVVQNKHKLSIFNQTEVTNEISDTCKDAKNITNKSFQLCRKKSYRNSNIPNEQH